MPLRLRLGAPALALALTVSAPLRAQVAAEPLFVDVRQGTDLSLSTRPGLDFVVIELLGRLWQIPVSGGAATPLTPPQTAVRHPRLNRDGTRVVYQRLGESGWDIWLLDLDTGHSTAVTSAPGNEREPDFMPGGQGFVFAADRGGSFDLWSVERPGDRWQPVTTEPGDARYPSVAANGAIAYVEKTDTGESLRVRAAGLTRTVFETSGELGAPSWRPGGGVIVFAEHSRGAHGRLRMAILAPELLVRELARDEDVFASRVGWLGSARFLYAADGQIWQRGLAGNNRRPVHLFATAIVAPPAAPGRQPAQERRATAPSPATADGGTAVASFGGVIWLVRDGEPTMLTDGPDWDESPVLDPAGRFVVFARTDAAERRLWRVAIDAQSPAEPLTPAGERAFAPALDPSGSRLAWLSSSAFSAHAPAVLNTLDLDSGTHRRSAHAPLQALSPPSWLDDNRLAMLSIETLRPDGTIHTLAFDAALDAVDIGAAAPAGVPVPPSSGLPPAAQATLRERLRDAVPAPDPARYVIQAGRVFDGVGTHYQRHVDIHIESGEIVAVVARGRLPLPESVIDATQRTVLPGLIDVHAHDISLLGPLAGRAWLAWGVTTVRSAEPLSASQLAMASAWNAGALPGPRLIAPEPPRETAQSTRFALQPPALLDDPFVTLPGEYPDIDPSSALLPLLQPAGPRALPRRYSPGFAHYQDVYSLLAAARATEISSLGVFAPEATATLLHADAGSRRAFEQLFSAADRRRWERVPPLAARIEARQLSLTRLLRAGGRVAIGTETPHTPPGLGEHIELQLFAAAGVPADQVLRSATSAAALALGLDARIGTIEAGRRADLVIVSGDPLNDIADTLAIEAVVRDGRWIERAAVLQPDQGNLARPFRSTVYSP